MGRVRMGLRSPAYASWLRDLSEVMDAFHVSFSSSVEQGSNRTIWKFVVKRKPIVL